MAPARRFVLRFVSLFRSSRAERDLAREIQAHLQMSVVSIGWNAYAAPRAASHYAFRAEDYLTLRLEMDRESTPAASSDAGRAAFRAQFTTAFQEMERRLELDPGVAAVTHTTRLPGKGNVFFVEVDSPAALRSRAADDPLWVRSAVVAADYFAALDAPIVSGRAFTPARRSWRGRSSSWTRPSCG